MNMLGNSASRPLYRKTVNHSLSLKERRKSREQTISQNGLVTETMALSLSGFSKKELSRLVKGNKITKTDLRGRAGPRVPFYSIKDVLGAADKPLPAAEFLKGAGSKIDPEVSKQLIDPHFRKTLELYGEPEKLRDLVVCCLLKTQPEAQPAFMSAVLPGLLSLLHETFNSDGPMALRIISQMKQEESYDMDRGKHKKRRWELILKEVKDWCACTRNNAAVLIGNELEKYDFKEMQPINGVRALSRRCASSNGAGISIVVFLAPPYPVEFYDSAGRRLANPKVAPEELEIAKTAMETCSAFIPSLSDFASGMDYHLAETKATREVMESELV